MSTIDEMLDEQLGETENPVCSIDRYTRKIILHEECKFFGVENDKKVERIKFECSKFVGDENLDLTECTLLIVYENANGEPGLYNVEDISTVGENVNFSWLFDEDVTRYKGEVKFIFYAYKNNGGETETAWNTIPAFGRVEEGLDAISRIEERNPSVLESMLVRIVRLEKYSMTGEQVVRAIEDYQKQHPAKIPVFDWDDAEGEDGHVLNRPFYSEYEDVRLMDATQFVTEPGPGHYYADLTKFVNVAGYEKCTVIFDGVAYDCLIVREPGDCRITYKKEDETVDGAYVAGWYFEFALNYYEEPDWLGTLYTDLPGTHTAEIIGKKETAVHKIPEKYLPENLGGGIDVQGATPGQTIIVKAVDSEGKPTEWEAVDFPEGGSGGGAQADWNAKEGEPGHILNRPFYSTETIMEIVPECQPLNADGTFMLLDAVDIADGYECVISWNGTEYQCTAADTIIEGMPMVALGNMAAAGGADTGEPFFIGCLPPALAAEMGAGALIIPMDGTTELTLKVTAKVTDVKKLDNKYLDLDWLPIKTPVDSEVFPETEIPPNNLTSARIDANYLSDGDNVKVTFDGTDYECTVKSIQEGAYYFGNLSLMDNQLGNTGEPFLYTAFLTDIYSLKLADSDTHTIRVTKTVYEYNVLPSGYLGGGDTLYVNLTSLGLARVVSEKKGTLSLDTTEIINRLKRGQQVKMRFEIDLALPSGSTHPYSVTAVLSGTMAEVIGEKPCYYYSDVILWDTAGGYAAYAVSLSVFDGYIEVINHLL